MNGPYLADHSRPRLQVARRLRRPGTTRVLLLSEGQMSDYNGPAVMVDALPKARRCLACGAKMRTVGAAR